MEDSETVGAPPPARAVERVTLGKEEVERVFAWLKQLEDSSKGFLQLSRADVVNFLIREHKAELSSREVHQIRQHHYDPIRHLSWITPRLKEALQRGDTSMVLALQAEIRTIELSVVANVNSVAAETSEARPRKARRRRSPESEPPTHNGLDDSLKETQDRIPEG